mmetsp:Transcript_386/g.787  ORF Transcript_386/g.787 Transcript_386/m.787 type:complete len:210 (-) Transcript_386:307-936(-)
MQKPYVARLQICDAHGLSGDNFKKSRCYSFQVSVGNCCCMRGAAQALCTKVRRKWAPAASKHASASCATRPVARGQGPWRQWQDLLVEHRNKSSDASRRRQATGQPATAADAASRAGRWWGRPNGGDCGRDGVRIWKQSDAPSHGLSDGTAHDGGDPHKRAQPDGWCVTAAVTAPSRHRIRWRGGELFSGRKQLVRWRRRRRRWWRMVR